jgi:hypothetical protein
MIRRWYRLEQAIKRRGPGFQEMMINIGMKALERKAKQDPGILDKFGGDIESARRSLRAQLSAGRSRGRRKGPLEIRKTLVQQSAIARVIATTPSSLDAYLSLDASERDRVISENGVELFLHQIRRGELDYRETFAERLQEGRKQFAADLNLAIDKLTEKPRNSNIADTRETRGQIAAVKGALARFAGIAAFLNARKYRRRVHQAKGKFFRDRGNRE